jgi:hypothetical protein
MYTDVRSCVRLNSQMSDIFSSDIGLKQGDTILLFCTCFFVNDFSQNMNTNIDYTFTANELYYYQLLYVDDQVPFAKYPTSLQLMTRLSSKLLLSVGVENNYYQN